MPYGPPDWCVVKWLGFLWLGFLAACSVASQPAFRSPPEWAKQQEQEPARVYFSPQGRIGCHGKTASQDQRDQKDDRQAIQWFIADSATDIHASRLMTHHAASKFDAGENVRQEASMLKVFATEMATRVADRAMQMHGGMGMSKDMPLEFIYRRLRPMHIFEGPSEVHRWVIARTLLRD